MPRSFSIIILTSLVASFAAPVALEAQHHGSAHAGGGMAARSAPSLAGRPVAPFVNPPVSVFGRSPGVASRPFVRPARPIVIAPAYGYGGYGYGYGAGYPYDSYSPYYGAPAASEPYYSEPQPVYNAPAGDQGTADLSYQIGMLSQQIQELRQQQAATAQAAPAPARLSTPVALIFRDGRRVEIQNYAIIGQTLWVLDQNNSSKIALSALDLDATQSENRSHGVRFSIPGQ
jgi:hypothetical protein